LIGTWDNSLSLDIIKSWASNIDKNGWVAREQILGDEARSRVPAEFQTQYPHFANPPTLVLALKAYLNRLQDARRNSNDAAAAVHFQGMGDEEKIVSGSDAVLMRDRHLTDESTAVNYLKDIYPAFKRQFEWFKKTQWGDIKSGGRKTRGNVAFRWRGRTPDHTLTSGEFFFIGIG
jgi:mannosyl-oligosaccharide glucosidase